MSFRPPQFTIKRKFGEDYFAIRLAKISDRELVWEGYNNAPKCFFKHKTEITLELINALYPIDGQINYEQALPFNVMRLDENGEEVEFAGNMTLNLAVSETGHVAEMKVGVLPKFQNRGIGTFLTRLSIKVAEALPNIVQLRLKVTESNHQARRIYRKCGFEEEMILEDHWVFDDGTTDNLIVLSVVFPEKEQQAKRISKAVPHLTHKNR